MLRATAGSVVLINPKTGLLEIEASVGLSERGRRLRLRPGEGITGWVALHGQAARIADVRADPRYIPARRHIRSELAVPLERSLSSPTGSNRDEGMEVTGVLNVDSTRVAAFSKEDEELLIMLAKPVSTLIQNAWLYEQARKRASQLDALLKLDQTLMAAETLPEVLQHVTRGASRLMDSGSCSILLLDTAGECLEWVTGADGIGPLSQRPPLSVVDSPLGVTVRRRKPAIIDDLQNSDPFLSALLSRRRKAASLLAAPLLIGDKVLGTLVLHTPAPHRFSNGEINIFSALANHAALAIQRCQLADRLFSTEEQLRQGERLSAIGLLAAEVAHEIRNPLTVIKMLTHSLARDITEGDPRRKDFEVLSRKMDQMNHTVERVLGLARSSEPVFESIPLNPVIEDLVLLIRHKLAQQNVRLKLFLEKDLPPARIDRAQIEQALLNLILNSIEAMPRGGALELLTGVGRPTLDDPPRRHFWIEVRDSGSGMSSLQRANLFQPFLTSRPRGTGLGMAIVNKIVKAHGGEVSVRPRSHRGLAVRITLAPRLST